MGVTILTRKRTRIQIIFLVCVISKIMILPLLRHFFLQAFPVLILPLLVRCATVLCTHWAGQSVLVIIWHFVPTLFYMTLYCYYFGDSMMHQTRDFNRAFSSSRYGALMVILTHTAIMITLSCCIISLNTIIVEYYKSR